VSVRHDEREDEKRESYRFESHMKLLLAACS
jgi:hypothetical protein